MKQHIAAIFLITVMLIFAIYISLSGRYYLVSEIISPTKIEILAPNKKAESETICIENIEAFSLEPDEKFYDKYSKKYDLTASDIISLGFLAQDYTEKLLQNKKVVIKYSPKITSECKYAQIKISGMDYAKLLANSGFGISKGKISNSEKFKHNLNNARKLNLVILNHHSGKYHTLDCPYGNAAHDKAFIPLRQLPKDAKPCKFCHHEQNIKKFSLKKDADIFSKSDVPKPELISENGKIKMIFTDFTETLKPNNYCSTQACRELKSFIDNTKSTLDIAIYGYDNNPQITAALMNAKQRGVRIRFVYDSTFNSQNNHYKDNEIIANISDSHISDISTSANLSNMIMHNKFLISDSKKVYTGSMNISSSGLSDFDVNNIVIIESERISELFTKEFEQMLNGKFHKMKTSVTADNRFITDDGEIEVYFSPMDNSVQKMSDLINNAKEYIYIPTFLITHRQISNALVLAKRRGVDVRVIMDANGAATSHTKIKELRDSGILLKTENYAGKLHAKSIIIDDKYIITGSMNFSYSGADKNDENVLIIKDEKLAKAYKQFFLYLWTKIPNKYLKQNANPESPESIGSCHDGVDNNFNGKVDSQEPACTNY